MVNECFTDIYFMHQGKKLQACFVKYDLYGKILFISNEVATFLGYEPNELLNKTVYEFFHPEDLKGLVKVHAEIVQDKYKIVNLIHRMRHKEGNFIWVSSHSEATEGSIISFMRKVGWLERTLKKS